VFVCLFVLSRTSNFSAVTIAGDRAVNLDLCLALTAFSSEGSLTCHTYCDTGPSFLRSHPNTNNTWINKIFRSIYNSIQFVSQIDNKNTMYLQNLYLSELKVQYWLVQIFTGPRDLCFSGLIRWTAPFSRLLRHTRGCGESILTRISPCI
jgi:hypothetical protein